LYSEITFKPKLKNMKSLNVKNSKLFNKVLKSLVKYNELNNLRDKADDCGDDKEYNKLNNKCEIAFSNYLELLQELPKYEQKRIENSELYLIG
jgi:hypothetical protein